MEDKFRLTFEGEDKDLVSKIDSVTAKLNKTKQLNAKFSKERSALAREERKEAFNSLTLDEKRLRLTKQQLDLEKNLARARAQGNSTRVGALALSLARNRSSMRGIGGSSNVESEIGLGGAIASRFGPAALAGAVAAAARSALHFADETSDLADQLGVTKTQIIQITRAAGYAGASQGKVLGNLSSLSAVRSAALGGDDKAKALFSKYGVDPTKGNIIELAQAISNSLGPQGMQNADRGAMGTFFGRRPEGILATLKNIPEVGDDLESKIDRLDKANTRIEQFWNSVKDASAMSFASILQAGDFSLEKGNELRKRFPTLAKMFPAASGFLSLFENKQQSSSSFADKRRAEDEFIRNPMVSEHYEDPYRRSAVPQADALARMGLYIGGGPNNPSNLMKQQLSELKAIKEATRNQTQAIRNW